MKFIYSWLVLTVFFFGCQPSGSEKHERKKMPDLNSLGVGETTPVDNGLAGRVGFPFLTSNVDVQTRDGISDFISVSLLDPSFDSLAMSFILNNEKLAVPMLAQWASKEKRGVLIDLRTTPGSQEFREDFYIGHGHDLSIPVVFVWDGSSADRAGVFINALRSIPSIECRSSTFKYSGQQYNF